MRLIDADTVKQDIYKYIKEEGRLINPYRMLDYIDSVKTSKKAIPIEVFYKMIHNALADTKKENWEPEECPYDYFDGNRNAIHCMLDILCGDKDGDHDKFWEDYSQWEKRK